MSASDDRPRRGRWMAPSIAVGVAVLGVLAMQVLRTPPAPAPAPAAAPPPSPAPAGRSGRASVAIYEDGRPLADRWVVFHDPDGNVAATLRSGPDGKASSDVRAGGMVTVAYGASIHQLVTVVGVQPGDEVLIGERDDDEGQAGNTVAMARIKLPSAHPSAARYGVSMGVGTTDVADVAVPLRMPILRRFLVDQRRFPVLGLAFDGAGEATAFTFALATIGEKDGGEAEVHLPAWSTDWREHRILLAHAPIGLTTIKGELAIVSGEDRFDRGVQEAAIGPDETTLRFRVPRPLGVTAVHRLALAYGTSRDKALLARRSKVMPPEVRLDLREALLPRVSGATVDRARDLGRPLVRWATSGGGAKADAAVMQLAWPETREHVWTIIAPPTTPPGFEVPALPAVLAAWRPDARPLGAAVALIEASEYAGYDDVRKKGIHLVAEPPEDDDATVTISVTGDLVF